MVIALVLVLIATAIAAIAAGIKLLAHAVLVSTTSRAIVRVAQLPDTGAADAAKSIAIALASGATEPSEFSPDGSS